MRGDEVRKVLIKNGFQLKDVAEKMGETPQNLQSLLNSADIKTGVLERIGEAINKNLYFFIEEPKPPRQRGQFINSAGRDIISANENSSISTSNEQIGEEIYNELNFLRSERVRLLEEVAKKSEEIIEMLKKSK